MRSASGLRLGMWVTLAGVAAAGAVPAQETVGELAAAAQDAGGFERALLRFPLECQDLRGCRIDCFQNGVAVMSRSGINQHDSVQLVASPGSADLGTPRWIEIRPFNNSRVQTLLLTDETVCDLQGLIITAGKP